ncbi:MucBP domain-containing protein [Gemella sp. 20925_1_85]
MFSKNNTKMNNKKQFEKINHYGIKKFNAGTASVLIASAFLFLGGAAQAADTNKQEATVATTEKVAAEKPTEEKVETKPAVAEKAAEAKEVVEAPKAEVKAEAKKEVNKATLQAKISQLDNLFVMLAGKELSETKQAQTVSAAVELNKAKDLVASESATQAEVDAQVVALEAAINSLNKVEKTVEKATDKKEETKKEEKSETKVAKENLEKAVSEAKVVNQAATTFATKEVKEEAPKAEIKAAVATSEKEIAKALDIFNSDSSTKSDADQQRKELEKAIEAVYVTMQRAGHRGRVEAILADATSGDKTITGKGVIRNGNAIVTVNNAYVTMNADNTAPKAWGIDVVFDTSQAQNGDTTTIEMKNLTGFGDSFKPGTKITAADGTVIGEVVSKATTNSAGNRNGKAPFWAQRNQDGMTYEERVAEQPAIPNEVGTTTYTIRWNDNAKNYAVTTFYAENLTAIDYYAPNISKDTEYTAAISVNGQPILEHKYTHKASKSAAQKQNTSATIMGDNILGYKGSERVRKSDAVVINTDSDVRYGKGSKFTITLPNDDFTYFKAIEGSKNTATNTNKDDSITYRPAGRWNNVQANANNVWILNDGRDTNFTLKATVKSPTELEIEVIDGAIQEDSIVSIGLDKLGVEKVITNRTFSDEYSKFIYDEAGRLKEGSVVGDTDKTAATLTVSGGTPLNGGEENVTTKVANGWKVEVGAGGNSQFETGAVTITLVNIETGEEFAYEPTNYDGYAKPNEDGSYETKNILGKKYDVSNKVPDLTKTIKGVEYIRVDVPAKGTSGTVNIGPKRASAIYSSEELQANGVNPNAFVNNVVYYYVKKTKVEEVNRTIKYVYAEDAKDLAGQQVFEPTTQTVSYTGTIQVNDKNEAQVDANRKPIYINWVGNGDTTLPEVKVPQKEGYIASVEKVAAQPTTATDEDYEFVVTYTPIQKARTTFVYQDKDGNVKQVEGNTPVTETGKGGDKLTKAEEIANKIKEAQNKGYELVYNTYPTDGVFDKDKDVDQEYTVTLKERVVPVTPDQPKTPGTPVDPNNPEGPKYPAGLEEKDLNKTVTRTITYVYADGTPVMENGAPKVVIQEAKFTREAKVNLVTGGVTYGDWTPAQDLAEVKSPEIAKHTVDKATVATVQVTNASENINEVVTYTPVQKATTTFIYQDKDGNVKQVEGNEPISETGTNGEKLTKAEEIANKIKEAQNIGYELVSNTYPTDGVFDKDVNTDQEFTVTLKERVVPVTPDQPKTPGTPVDPNNPEGPKYPAGLEEKDLNKTVTRTITYVYEDGTPVLGDNDTPRTEIQQVKFTREAKVNLVTGEVTYGDWTPAQDLAEVKSPVVKGYLADKATVAKVTVDNTSKDITEVVTYKPLGSWVPNIPGQPTDPIKYPNDPTDPTKPGTDKPKVPYVPGFTPKDKDGNPLKPVNPNNPEEGYEVPNIPTNPGEDTPINYVKDTQKAKTTFVDEKGNPIPGVAEITEQGGSETPLTKEDEVKAKIKELENKGYELVSNTYPTDGVFDKDVNTDQEYTVTLKERVVPVTPDQPKTPGTPVDPNNPEGPKYPAGLEEKDLNKTVTRTITYVYEDGTPVLGDNDTPRTETQQVKFTRNAKVNLVTGEVTYGDWTPAQDLAEVKSPRVKGYLADKATVAKVTVDNTSKDITEVVTYKPLGSWVPNIPGQPTDPIKYPNDPTDPTKPGSEKPKVPHVPGFTPKDKDGNPLKPVNPNNPEEGYEVPSIPTNPGQDTPINYVKDTQKAKTTFVDEKGNPIPGVDAITEEGDSDTPLTKEAEVKAKIKELENKGYELVSNTYPEGGKFDKDKDTDQEFKVTLKERVVPVTPDQPKTPGTPVDPNNPEGPKYPAGLEEKDLNKTVTRTIAYVYEDGTPVLNEDGTPKTVTQEAKFTREAKVNLVTGEVTYGDWSEAKDLAEVKSPVVKGFVADKASVAVVNVTADSEDIKEVVTYKPLGSWVPNIPGQPTNPIKYPNDPTDPTKPGAEKPKVPYVPGFTPKDKDGNPLKPVNPNNPEEGYEVPNIPTNPGEDTPINYVANKAKLVVKYVDENGKDLAPSETTEGKVGDEYTTSGKVIPGYVLVRVDGEAKGKIGKDGSTVTYVYKPLGSWIPNIPGQPTNPIKYPNDPTDPTKPGTDKPVLPYVPGHTPVDGNGQPLKPVDPKDPSKGYITPDIPVDPGKDTPINYVANKAKLVVKYVDEKGKDLIPAETTEGHEGDEYTTTGKVIKGYVLVRVEGEAKGKIGKDGSTVTYVYKPLGSWIPNIPGQPINPIKYPNDPTDPTKPGTDKPVLPYVPGYTPVDGNGQPLKPVDPQDPTKGYIVPDVPTNPGQDTPINYIPAPKPQPTPVVTPEKPVKNDAPVQPKANAQVKRLANTGTTETNTGLAGLGLATIAGLLTAARRRKEK